MGKSRTLLDALGLRLTQPVIMSIAQLTVKSLIVFDILCINFFFSVFQHSIGRPGPQSLD